MSPFAGPLFAAALLLVGSGGVKLWRPDATRIALRTGGLPSTPSAARALGVAEVAIAAYALIAGGRLAAALVAVTYLGFAGYAERLRRVGRGSVGCGCFGASSAPVSRIHVAVDLAVAAAVTGAVISPASSVSQALADTPWAGTVFAGFTLVLAWLLLVALTALPEALAATRAPRTLAR